MVAKGLWDFKSAAFQASNAILTVNQIVLKNNVAVRSEDFWGAARVRLARLRQRSMFENPVTGLPSVASGEGGSRNDAKTQKTAPNFPSFNPLTEG